MTLANTYRITQYDPADRDGSGGYVGDVDSVSDEGPLEAAYLDAVEAFAREVGVTHLEIRDPYRSSPGDPSGIGHPERDPDAADSAVVEVFGEELTGFVDGAIVDIASALLLVRGMLRGGPFTPGWCRLEAPEMTVHVGWDVYMYITTDRPCPVAVRTAAAAGLFPEHWPGSSSPYATEEADEQLWRSMHTPIDDAFWARVDSLVRERGAALLQEDAAWTRWHRTTVDAPRPALRPRCRVWVWPDLTTDIPAVIAHLDKDDPDDIQGTVVWQTPDGCVRHENSLCADNVQDVRTRLADAIRAQWYSDYMDDQNPLIEAVMPDRDGVIRARWEPLSLVQGTN